MATKSKPVAQTDFFSATTEFTQLPPKKYAYQKVDPLESAREGLAFGIRKQLDILHGGTTGNSRKWFVATEHNGIYCQIRLRNTAMVLNGSNDAFHASNVDDAKRLYSLALDAIEAGQFNGLIETHLKNMKPRAPRGSKKLAA